MSSNIKSCGVVLKNLQPRKHTLVMLDERLGKIECVAPKHIMQRACNGALLEYGVQATSMSHVISDVHIIDVPLSLARTDILFVHHLLELCHAFLQIGDVAPSVFSLVHALFFSMTCLDRPLLKKIVVLRLFALLGIYPEVENGEKVCLQKLLSLPIDRVVTEKIDLDMDRLITRWIYQCIAVHPDGERLHTMHFLTRT